MNCEDYIEMLDFLTKFGYFEESEELKHCPTTANVKIKMIQ